HGLNGGFGVSRLYRRGGLPFEDLGEGAVRGAHQIRRAVRHEPFFPEDRDVILEDFPKQPLLSFFRSIRRTDIHAHCLPQRSRLRCASSEVAVPNLAISSRPRPWSGPR